MKIKKNDHVVVVAGRDRGRTGLVIAAYPDRGKVLVQGVNMVKKNKKVTYQGAARRQGGRHHARGSADRREQRPAGRPGQQAGRAGRLPVRRGRQQVPRRQAEREGHLMTTD